MKVHLHNRYLARRHDGLNDLLAGAVVVAVEVVELEELVAIAHHGVSFGGDEVVVRSIDFAYAWGACGVGGLTTEEFRVLVNEHRDEGALADAAGAGNDDGTSVDG